MRILIIVALLAIQTSLLQAQVRVKMTEESGVRTMPCTVNGLKLRFIFDTGASNVSISLSEAIFMLKNGYMSEDDIKGSSYSQIANGEIVENTTIILRKLEVGGIVLKDVEAIIIHELTAPLLLGNSAINKLGKVQIDGDELIIINPKLSEKEINLTKTNEEINVGSSSSEGLFNEENYEFFKENYGLIKESAEQGDTLSQWTLGMMYYLGEIVSQDYKQAFYWFSKSAEQGYSFAQYRLGYMFSQGEGVLKDIGKAIDWWLLASEQENALAQYQIGLVLIEDYYYTNDEANWTRAAYFIRKAYDNGYEEASEVWERFELWKYLD